MVARCSPLLFLLLAWRFTSFAAASVFTCTGGSVYIVAHPDDDLLFQSPDLLHDVQAGNCITGVYLTSGDSGYGSAYAQSRESGNEAAWAVMAGVDDVYAEFNATFGGQPVLVRTLVGAPQIQKVWVRLGDGGVDGSGYAVTGYMSLRDLWFGVIGSITNQPGTATYTLATLQQAVSEILLARQPDNVRSLDHLSDYDAGDHSDHLTVGRLTKAMADSYLPNANHTGYMGYPVSNLAPTLTAGSDDSNGKNDAFFVYSPYDSGECQSFALCKSAGRGEYFWLLRQYAVTSELAETSTIGTAQTQAVMPTGGSNVANVSTVTASSAVSGQPAFAAIDGNIGGYPGNSSAEWVSDDSTVGKTFLMDWGEDVYNITSVVLYDRPNVNDWITGGTLAFSDNSETSFGSLYNDGSATVINLDPMGILTTYILLTVTSVASTTSQIGLSEFQAFGIKASANATSSDEFSTIDIALNATAIASSEESSTGQVAASAIDGYISGYKEDGSGSYWEEWASGTTVGTTLTLTWSSAVSIARVILYDRPNLSDQITGGTLTYDDGSSTTFGALVNSGSATYVDLASPINSTTLVLTVTSVSSTTNSAGLAEIQVYGVPGSNTDAWSASSNSNATSTEALASSGVDLALNATAVASSQSDSTGQTASAAIDGYISGYKEDGTGTYWEEWASGTTVGTTLTLTWSSAINITQVVLYDRPNLSDQITGGMLTFDDGSSVTFGALVNDGSATYVNLTSAVTTSSLLLTVTSVSSTTSSAGLAEIEVFGWGSASSNSSDTDTSSSACSTGSFATDLALSATAVASSDSAGTSQTADKAIDGEISGYMEDGTGSYWEEWASGAGVGTTLTLSWTEAVTVQQVILYDRPNLSDQITSGTLTFDDGSSVSFGALFNDGSATCVNLTTSVNTTSILLTVTGVSSTTTSAGLAEIQVYGESGSASNSSSTTVSTPALASSGVDLALNATAVASSQSDSTGQTASAAIDGYISGYKEDGSGTYWEEWASGTTVGTTLTLTWSSAINITQVVLYDRPNLSDQITGGMLTFDDGSSVTFGALVNDGSATDVNLTSAVTTSSLLLTVTSVSSTTSSAGLAEIEVFGWGSASSNSSDTDTSSSACSTGSFATDLALSATAVASSDSAGTSQTADKAIDGEISGYMEDGTGSYWEEWASGAGVGTTLTLSWTEAVTVQQVILYDRPNLSDQITSGTLTFDDGSSVSFGALFNDGSATCVNLTTSVNTTSILLTVTGVSSTTTSAGLAEIQVYGSTISDDTTNTTSTITSALPSSTANSTVSLNSTSTSNASTPVSTSFNFTATITGNTTDTSTSLFPSATDFNLTSTDSGNATETSTSLFPSATDFNSTSTDNGNATETSTSLFPSATDFNSTSTDRGNATETSTDILPVSTALNSTSSVLPSFSANETSSALPTSSGAVNSTSSALPSSTGLNSTSVLPSSTVKSSTITSASNTASSRVSSTSSSTLNAAQSRASVSSASSASMASASSASAASRASASSQSVASASASKASASAASASQASASSASVASASSSRAAASSQSVAQASASRASASSASLASVSSASAASASSVSASKASASAASVSSASAASASRASVASVSSASVAAARSTSMVTVTRSTSSATQTSATSTAMATAPAQATSVNIAQLGTATASSYRASSPPSGVNDGNVGGLSLLGLGTASQEWSTGSSATPAWVQINFSEFYLMKTVYLYAPVNTLNTITGGTLTLSDGSSFSVGSVSSSGTAVSLGSAGKTISWLRFTITKTGVLNSAVGLAEIRAYNNVAKTSCSLLDVSCLINAIL